MFPAITEVDGAATPDSNGCVPRVDLEVLLACWVKRDGGAAVGSRPKVFPQTLELELRRKVGDDGETPVEIACRVSSLMPAAELFLEIGGKGGVAME